MYASLSRFAELWAPYVWGTLLCWREEGRREAVESPKSKTAGFGTSPAW